MRELLPAQRAELDRALAPITPTVIAARESGAPDWWEGEDAEAMAMMAMVGGNRG